MSNDSIFRRMGSTISTKIEAVKAEFQTGISNTMAALQASIDNTRTELQSEIDTKIVTATTTQYKNTPYDIATAVVNKPSGNAKVLRFAAPRTFTIPTNALGSLFKAGVVSHSQAVFFVFKNTTQIGTITFSAGVANGVCAMTQTVFTQGDILSIVAPPIQDQKLADIMITISARL